MFVGEIPRKSATFGIAGGAVPPFEVPGGRWARSDKRRQGETQGERTTEKNIRG